MTASILSLFLCILFPENPSHTISTRVMDKSFSCFSEDNFNLFYQYVEKQIDADRYCIYKEYELYIIDPTTIAVKKNNYTLVIIEKERGICSLAKFLEKNREQTRKVSQIFCEIILLQREAG